MDSVLNHEPNKGAPSADSLEVKIQKLINNFSVLKEKYTLLKEDHEKVLTSSIELEEEKNHLTSEKSLLIQKITQLEEELMQKSNELKYLKDTNTELDAITKTAVSKIDSILSQVDFDI